MSLALALNTALSGLNVNQRALSVLAQNIANANTQGYSRKIVNQQALYLDGNGVGASIDSITRKVDEYIIKSIRLQNSVVGRAATAGTYADRTQLLLGSLGSGNSINSHATRFFGALQSLAQTPEDGTLQGNAINQGVTLARQVSSLAQGLQDMRFQADQDLSTAISIINSDLQQIHSLNASISQDMAQGKSVTELLDQRDKLIGDISQYMDVQTFSRENGTLSVSCNGIALLDDALFQISYEAASSVDQLANDNPLSAVLLYRVDENGNQTGNPTTLVTGGTGTDIVSVITTGKIKALLEQRDVKLPNMISQLDLFTATFRDRVNALHNAGVAFPGANSYTGTRTVTGGTYSEWAGRMRIAVLQSTGAPVDAPYSTLTGGLPPLTIDLSTLNGGFGAGKPTVQSIINEINQYYGSPQNKVQVGNISNIRLASLSTELPGSPAEFSFDLDLENLSADDANVFVTDVTVLDSDGTDITSVTEDLSPISIDATDGFVTENGSPTVTINTSSAHGLQNGDTIYLPSIAAAIAPETDLNGIPLSELNGKSFTISNVTSTSFEITVTSDATSTGSVTSSGATLLPPYAEIEAGETARSGNAITASLTGNSSSPYYTIKVNVAVVDEDGVLKTSEVTYRVTNDQEKLLNDRYAARDATADGTIIEPDSNQVFARAILVDAEGRELPKTDGEYSADAEGFLKIVAGNSSYAIAIDSLNSSENGLPDNQPPVTGTGRGFSHYFNLNDFFVSSGDDETAGSALSFAVATRLINDPSLMSLGALEAVPAAADGSPNYAYQRTIGNNSFVQQMADLGLSPLSFAATGGLGATVQTFAGYAAQIISAASLSAAAVKSESINAQSLLDGYIEQGSSISGVNLDEELANTVIYQNAYSASARVITVANDLFEDLLQTF